MRRKNTVIKRLMTLKRNRRHSIDDEDNKRFDVQIEELEWVLGCREYN